MINLRNIVKVLLMAMFVCALSGEVKAQAKGQIGLGVLSPEYLDSGSTNKFSYSSPTSHNKSTTSTNKSNTSTNKSNKKVFKITGTNIHYSVSGNNITINDNGKKTTMSLPDFQTKGAQGKLSGGVMTAYKTYTKEARKNASPAVQGLYAAKDVYDSADYTKETVAQVGERAYQASEKAVKDAGGYTGGGNQQAAEEAAKDVAGGKPNGENSANFCSGDFGIFSSLVKTGQTIFQRLRDLIYVVAGFGIIAVAVGGFFGNLNWKWLGAIVISLVVIATAGELIVLVTGCEQFGSSLITNTLENPTAMSVAEYQGTYTEDAPEVGSIQWNDDYARAHPETYAGTKAQPSVDPYDDGRVNGYDITSDEKENTGNTRGLLEQRKEELADQFNFDKQVSKNQPAKVELPKLELPPLAPLN